MAMQQETTAKVGSVIFIFAGILLIMKPSWYSYTYSMEIDFTEIKWLVGGSFILTGIVLLWTVMRAKAQSYIEDNYICPKCEEVYRQNINKKSACTKCGVELELLNGFYEKNKNIENKV